MRCARHILAIAFLAYYVVHVVGGHALHLWHCADDACCVPGPVRVVSSASQQADCEDCSFCHHAEDAAPQQQHHQAPGNERRHDPSNCWVCYVFAQSQDKSIEPTMAVSVAVRPVAIVSLPCFYPPPCHAGFRSRAPPVVNA